MANNNTALIVVAVVGGAAAIVITVVLLNKKPATPLQYYPANYNPALYPPGYVAPTNNNDKAALYTASANVITKALDTFFGSNSDPSSPYAGLSGQQMEDSIYYGGYTDNNGTAIYTNHG